MTNRPAALSPKESKTYQYNMINFPGWFRKGDNDNFQAIYDNIYVAIGPNHVARIELTNSPNYKDSTKLFTIPYESWSDNKISLDIEKTGISNVDALYIYIFDRDGNRTANGLSIKSIRNKTLDFIIHKILNDYN
jgi:hypothetical protein